MLRKPLFWIAVFIVLVAAGVGYYYYQKTSSTVQAASDTPIQTATVRRGNLILSASGTGSVITKETALLGFETAVELAQLNVEVGDQVKEGDVLAVSSPGESTASLQSKLSSARLAVLQAQQDLDEINSSSNDLSLAQTQSNLAQKQLELIETQSKLTDLTNERATMHGTRCDDDTIADYQQVYDRAWERWNVRLT
jgi:multidrug efflux pump subunit AcrA (membrane-fusion protein)